MHCFIGCSLHLAANLQSFQANVCNLRSLGIYHESMFAVTPKLHSQPEPILFKVYFTELLGTFNIHFHVFANEMLVFTSQFILQPLCSHLMTTNTRSSNCCMSLLRMNFLTTEYTYEMCIGRAGCSLHWESVQHSDNFLKYFKAKVKSYFIFQ